MVSSSSLDEINLNCSIGSRISSSGGRGTVLYIGAVAPHEGLWLGIDWDDPSRGKHDGSYNKVRYFTSSSPTSGSFVRPNKVDYGCDFMKAVHEKYAPSQSDHFDGMHHMGKRTIEFVGMEKISSKQSQLGQLRNIVLDSSLLSRSGDDLSIIADSLPNVVELHMCRTLLSDWTVVERICQHLEKLSYLNLSLNFFKPLDSDQTYRPLTGIRSLILTECRLTWNEVNGLSALFPNLMELGLCKNRITSIDSVGFTNLQSLDLEGNPIGDFSGILALGGLKRLETLNLNNTGLSDFEIPSTSEVPFPALKIFYMCNNAVKKWQTVNELSRLPSLEHLFIHDNPIMTTESKATSAQIVIAKIKNLKGLDRQIILPQERRGAEIDSLKYFGRQRTQMSKEEFSKEHPRYEELCQTYGAPEDWEMKTVKTGLLKLGILDLNIEVPGREALSRKVPGSMTVEKLKALIGRMYSIDVRRMQLSYESEARPGVIVPLENDLRDLIFYSLESGNRVLVNVSS